MVLSLREYGQDFMVKLFHLLLTDHQFFLSVHPILEKEFFVEESYKVLFSIIIMHFEKYYTIPSFEIIRTYFAHFKNDNNRVMMNDILKKIEESECIDERYIQDKTIEFCRHQIIKKNMILASKELKLGNFDAVENILLQAIQKIDIEHNMDHDYWEGFDLRSENVRYNIRPTGWGDLDRRLNGGLGAGELGVIIAPTGFGKSYSLINMACGAIRQGYNALFYSLELSSFGLGIRADAHFSGIEIDEIQNRKDEVRKILMEKRDSMGNLKIRKFPTKSRTVGQLKTYTEKLRATGFKPDVIFVDYADIIKPSNTDNEKRQQLGEIYEELRGWADEIQTPIGTASQTNRQGLEKEFISIVDMAESFEKAMVADVIIGQTRTPEQKANNEATFFLSKSRVGKDGFFYDSVFNTALTEIHVRELSNYESEKFTNKPSKSKSGLTKEQANAIKFSYAEEFNEKLKS